MAACQVKFMPESRTIEVEEGTSLVKAASQAGIYIKSGCGAKGSCGACRVIVLSGEPEVRGTGKLTPEDIARGVRLSCQTFVHGDVTVEVPPESRLQEHQVLMEDVQKGGLLQETEQDLLDKFSLHPLATKVRVKLSEPTLTENASDWARLQLELRRILAAGVKGVDIPLSVLQTLPEALRQAQWDVAVTLTEGEDKYTVVRVEKGNDRPPYGLAIDIGTTTVVVYLVDLSNGRVIDKQGTYNKQAKFGDDVISRIVYAVDAPGNLQEIQRAVIDTINGLTEQILSRQKLEPADLGAAVVAGNTTMTQLFLGVDPRYVRLEPYIPTMNGVPPLKAQEIGLKMVSEGLVHCFPSVASYVGGDIVSGTMVTDMANGEEIVLFIDIGTNGEIVLGNQDWLVSCACSAGPCFEGGGILFGMRAMPGAIERVYIDPDSLDVSFKVIGRILPVGICGSGLVDALAKLREAGIIDRAGNFQMEHPSHSERLRLTPDDKEFVLAWAHQAGGDKDVVITENDVKNLIRAKGAIYAGIRSLLTMVAVDVDMISRIVIAGGFGNYLNVHDSVEIGLLPDVPAERYEFIGNSSVKGARLALLSQNAWHEAAELGKKMTYIELSVGTTFMDEFVSALFLPHTDLSLFPSVVS
ncbi:2Fe-2S ferredoxin-type iron-sulfur binding domain protein [Acididesulfobacillus acetoxydans]|uniref:2Fe-2S ferredoxin-type iron-sulfur binding domain protein n=1 Tax=Acididesulfobacillus acetoxydans TaxID=1561005 RepID=A0A8S0WPD4_9FIRM|nr:ASKHA domain-containing protein [Acididesulfobacillus acetoxydans]CAA7601844.1 2Fe-2S ferredoxin-type iron-sulfur binding domain protein [Acididesulfobacillus acetoxydans]CEJ06849.1 2Fe-2S iron-sulfur cluster binding domain protein [Acididesulfobacillus acetoxydans]